MTRLEGLCVFGLAAAANGTAFRYKLLGVDAPTDNYSLVLEVTNGLASFIARFTLDSIIKGVERDSYATFDEPGRMLSVLKQRYKNAEVQIEMTDDGLQLVDTHQYEDLNIVIRLPPDGPMAPLQDPKRSAWVVQDVLFSTGERLRQTENELDACEERCPPEAQMEDVLAFLTSRRGSEMASEGDLAAPSRPEAPRIATLKRKQGELQLPGAGSAVKRPGMDVSTASGAGGAASGGQQPSSTQLTGVSSQSRRTATIGAPKVVKKPTTRPGMPTSRNPIKVGRKK